MNKIICIGECSLDLVVSEGRPTGLMPGGRIALAAARLARLGFPVAMASEASADPVGDLLVKTLTDAGVDCTSVDRFIQGHSPLTILTPATDAAGYVFTRYEDYGDGGFDIVWPRVDDKTIIVYGGYYVLDARMRQRLVPFLNNCSERGCVMVYVPGFRTDPCHRMTRVMPAILENLELASIVVARNEDLASIFGMDSDDRCYKDHIDFYCRSMVNVDVRCGTINYFSGREMTQVSLAPDVASTMLWNDGPVAGVVSAIYEGDLSHKALDGPGEEIRRAILTAAARMAHEAATGLNQPWQRPA